MVQTKDAQSKRRTLTFKTLDEVRADIEALVAAQASGRLHQHGKWTLGQALGHLGSWIDFGFDGYPMKRLPWVLRWVGPIAKRRVLQKGMSPGMRLPGAPVAGTYATDALSTEQGREKVLTAIARLEATSPTQPNPIFGLLTHEEWKQLHLSHCSLHLSFFEIGAAR